MVNPAPSEAKSGDVHPDLQNCREKPGSSHVLKSSSLRFLSLHNSYDIFSLVLEQLGSRWVNGGWGQCTQRFSYQAVGVRPDFDSPYATLTGSRGFVLLASQNHRLPDSFILSDWKACSLLHSSQSTTSCCNKNDRRHWFMSWHLEIWTMNMLTRQHFPNTITYTHC